jgi:cholesterol transport system auxiliary component
VSDASAPLDAFTLSPVTGSNPSGGRQHIVVPAATSSGALATDRILIKPNRLQAAYLPDGRWVDPAPVLLQNLAIASLQSGGGFRLVSRDDGGLAPDLTLLLDLSDFQAEAPATSDAAWTVRVALIASLVREDDRSIAASRRFEATSAPAGDSALAIVSAFDTATQQVLRQLVAWVAAQSR